MEDNFNQDRLEAFFRKSLEHFEEKPAPDAWEKIRRSIPEKDKKRNLGTWLWTSLLLLGLVIAGSHFILSNQFDKLEARVDNLEAEASGTDNTTIENKENNPQKENSSTRQAHTINKKNTSESDPKGTKKLENSPINPSSAKEPSTNESAVNSGSGKAQLPPGSSNTNQELIPSQSNVTPTVSKDPAEALEKPVTKKAGTEGQIMEDIPFEEAAENDTVFTNNKIAEEQSKTEDVNDDGEAGQDILPKKEPGIIFPFELAYGVKTTQPQFFEGDDVASSNQSAWDIQLIGDIPINHKWTFQMGAGYRRMDFSGTRRVSGIYSEVGAIGNTDIGISKNYRFGVDNQFMQLALLGKVTQTFEEGVSDPNLDNEDKIYFSTRVNHRTDHLIFPFLISRHGNGEKWNWRIKTGLIGTVRIQNEINAEVFGIENENIQFEHQNTISTYLYDGPKLEWALSAGVEYKIFGPYWLFAEPAMNMAFLGSFTGSKPFLYGVQAGLIWQPALKEKRN